MKATTDYRFLHATLRQNLLASQSPGGQNVRSMPRNMSVTAALYRFGLGGGTGEF